MHEEVFRLQTGLFSHMYYITGDTGILVDTGYPGHAGPVLREVGGMDAIFLTHHDVDHAGSAAKLQERTGAPVYVGAADLPFFSGARKEPGGKNLMQKLLGLRAPLDVRPLEEAVHEGIDILPMPGHTPGHTVFRVGGQVLCGDMFSNDSGFLDNLTRYHADCAQVADGLEALSELDADVFWPAHGEPLTATRMNRERLRNLAFLLRERMR